MPGKNKVCPAEPEPHAPSPQPLTTGIIFIMSKSRSASPALSTDWGEVAQWYDALVGEAGSEYHRHVVLPGVMRLLDAQSGHNVIDIACGQGVLCRLLRQRGAQAMGVDAAAELIADATRAGNGEAT